MQLVGFIRCVVLSKYLSNLSINNQVSPYIYYIQSVMHNNGFVAWANMLKCDDTPLTNNNFKSKYSKSWAKLHNLTLRKSLRGQVQSGLLKELGQRIVVSKFEENTSINNKGRVTCKITQYDLESQGHWGIKVKFHLVY